MCSIRSDRLVIFSASEMLKHGGTYQNYWGKYWQCPTCDLFWGEKVTQCWVCKEYRKPDQLAQSKRYCPSCDIPLEVIAEGDDESTDCLICPTCKYEEGGGLR